MKISGTGIIIGQNNVKVQITFKNRVSSVMLEVVYV